MIGITEDGGKLSPPGMLVFRSPDEIAHRMPIPVYVFIGDPKPPAE
jgi:hypothetical protein